MNKKLFVPVVAAATIAVGTLGLNAASAATTTTTYNFPPVVQQLVDKFNLPKDQVQQIIDQNRTQQQQKMQQRLQQKLNADVTAGKLTATQEQALLSELQNMQQQRQSLKGLSAADRKTKLQQMRQDFNSWAQQNGINLQNLGIGRSLRGWHRGT